MKNIEENGLMDTKTKLLGACESIVNNPANIINLEELLKGLKSSPEMAMDVWNYDSMPIILLQETISPYLILNTDEFGEKESSRVCMVLNVLQVLVMDVNVKKVFVDARFPYYIYKYLVISNTSSQYETLRIASLGVIASLLHNGDQYIHEQLKTTEIVPLLLKIIDVGSETSQMLSVNIFGMIIGNDDGLNYACQTFDRFSAINLMFNYLVTQAVQTGSIELYKSVLKVYIRLCKKPHIRALLSSKRPEGLFTDEATKLMSSDRECEALWKKFTDLTS